MIGATIFQWAAGGALFYGDYRPDLATVPELDRFPDEDYVPLGVAPILYQPDLLDLPDLSKVPDLNYVAV